MSKSNSLYSDIVNGIYVPNEYLPSDVTLSDKYNVSRNTLRQALAILNEDGLIIKSQGKGTIVAPQPDNNFNEAITNPMILLSRTPLQIMSYPTTTVPPRI